MPELVYPPVIAAAKTMFRVLDLRITVENAENVPRTGGAVLASNHVSYLDFIFCGLGAHPSKRLVRFMAKQSIFTNRVAGPLMRGMRHIPVDREAGLASYRQALAALKGGEIVGVFPEATISRSFTLKDTKNGAARMAAAARVPLIPMAVWGTQRLWTKGRPRTLTRRHTPISILIGEPLTPAPRDDANLVMTELRSRISALLDRAQREYPDKPEGPEDGWWQPAHLGGTAPTPEEAAALDAADKRSAAAGDAA
ncbi:1-acyl-sn-glycerol-3-phosphate acyltransferase [Planosporangium flavigriseum]|uniref:1-acyl-sn-glycerol-3-phosphate acyltransferase n=1 Tax=Planosporangium flavigriseum TaxID=373681 RepID=A0A8J3LKD5_9ACTN|nr:lysophospholipid acyltransferase family protein [Planosporangium flavigriseum]NJC64092.1 1-acyl-sn-glycerol-3-phosphate acyltransferase [Planosporangium flavigriseum]GIG72974.1 1-acyl-sn-glycerol-3-phosphate acyltransferase [Planosporangium flavigriseum]